MPMLTTREQIEAWARHNAQGGETNNFGPMFAAALESVQHDRLWGKTITATANDVATVAPMGYRYLQACNIPIGPSGVRGRFVAGQQRSLLARLNRWLAERWR